MAITELRALEGQGKGSGNRRDNLAALLFLTPWLVGLLFLTLGPMIASFVLSFAKYNLLQPPSWIGFDNFARMLTDTRLHASLRVTFIYVAVAVPLQLVVAFALALVLDTGLRGLAFYRSVFYLPSLLGGSVAIAILWRQIFGTEGLVNQFLSLFGIVGPGWVSHPDYALATLVILHVWTFGSPMVIFLAGLRQIPSMYYEAASIDGAGRLRQLWLITLPMMTPIIFFNLILQVISAFQSFTQAFVVSGGSGGPADATLFYSMYLYQKGFGSLQMGYASAMAWFLLLIIAGFTAINFVVSKYWVFYDD